MLTITVYETIPTGRKAAIGQFRWQDGRIETIGNIGWLEEQLKSGKLKVIIGDRIYKWEEGEQFLRALPYALHGLYLWAELAE